MGFPINPPTTALVDETRRPTPEFYRFLLEIQKMIGGASNPFEDTWLLGTPTMARLAASDEFALLPPPSGPVTIVDDPLRPDPGGLLRAVIAGLTEHIAAADPHPQYLTQAEGDARYGVASGALDLNIRTIAATGSPAADDYTLLVDASGGAVTVNLPAAASSTGRILVVKKIDASANAVTLDGNAAETIDGAATQATTTQWVAFTIQCDGSGWFNI